MTRFWDKMFELILSRGQREKHEKYLWDQKKFGEPTSPISVYTRASLDKPALPELRPTIPPPVVTSKGQGQAQPISSPKPSPSSSSTTSKSQWSSPHHSRPSSPVHPTTAVKLPRAPLPRHPREDRAYIIFDPLMETRNTTAIEEGRICQLPEHGRATKTITLPSTSPSKHGRTQLQPAILYEVPPLSEMKGIGRYRRSVNATDDFVDLSKARDDGYADLLLAAEKDEKRASGEWGKPGRRGNMDTTSPPPPRSAFCSRANSPVRLEYKREYGEDVDIFGEEELAEIDGKLLFCRRKSKGSSSNGKQEGDSGSRSGTEDSQGVTTSGEGAMTTADIVAAVAKQKAVRAAAAAAAATGGAFPKRKVQALAREEDMVKARNKSQDGRNGALQRTLKGDKIRVEHVEDLDEAAVATDDENFEEVESFSENKGKKLVARAARAGDKERTVKGHEVARRARKPSSKGLGQAGGLGGGLNAGGRAAGRLRGKPPAGRRSEKLVAVAYA